MKRIIGLLALIFTLCLFLPVMAAAADEGLPAGVIMAPDKMNWSDAKAYCASQSCRLPLLNGKNRIPGSQNIPSDIPVEVFGSDGAKWPSGLPFGHYWLGTERNTRPGHAWKVFDSNGRVIVTFASKHDELHAICIP